MKTLIVYARTDKIGSRCETEIEVEDDATPEEIEEQAKEAAFDMLEWGWKEAGK